MKIFISYSVDDTRMVGTIANHIGRHAEVYFWDKSKELGSEVWPLIFQWIDQADVVIAVITDNTVRRAMAFGQELGTRRRSRSSSSRWSRRTSGRRTSDF